MYIIFKTNLEKRDGANGLNMNTQVLFNYITCNFFG